MTQAQESPATFGWPPGPSSASSPRTYEPEFKVPGSPMEAEKLVELAEALVAKRRLKLGHLKQLATFLGANSAAWTVSNRARLRRVLAAAAQEGGIDAILAATQANPRTDVLDEAELALRAVAPEAALHMKSALRNSALAATTRACVLRALARVTAVEPIVHDALNAREPELREAAIAIIAELELPGGQVLLEGRLAREPNALLRKSIREALEAIAT